MKTKSLTLLVNTNSTLSNLFDNSQVQVSNSKGEVLKRNRSKSIEKERDEIKNSAQILEGLHELSDHFSQLPGLLTGPLRHLKVEPHYREPTCRLLRSPQAYRKTSKIRLTGNWIEKAGFNTHERIRVIPMHRMLIIVPEKQINNKHKGR